MVKMISKYIKTSEDGENLIVDVTGDEAAGMQAPTEETIMSADDITTYLDSEKPVYAYTENGWMDISALLKVEK